jgi:hypothetical protein
MSELLFCVAIVTAVTLTVSTCWVWFCWVIFGLLMEDRDE